MLEALPSECCPRISLSPPHSCTSLLDTPSPNCLRPPTQSPSCYRAVSETGMRLPTPCPPALISYTPSDKLKLKCNMFVHNNHNFHSLFSPKGHLSSLFQSSEFPLNSDLHSVLNLNSYFLPQSIWSTATLRTYSGS